MNPTLLAYRRAFEGYTGPPKAVMPGDFQRALELLDAVLNYVPSAPTEAEARALLKRLQPKPEDRP